MPRPAPPHPLRVLLVDNNDSFTYNIVNILRALPGVELDVVKAAHLHPGRLHEYAKLIISPGPGTPDDFPVLDAVIRHSLGTGTALLGICLGHQAICRHFGAELVRMERPVHGQRQLCLRTGTDEALFRGLPQQLEVGLYHSWAVRPESLPACLRATGRTAANVLMAVSHRDRPIHGVQFHPESFLTPHGRRMLENFLSA